MDLFQGLIGDVSFWAQIVAQVLFALPIPSNKQTLLLATFKVLIPMLVPGVSLFCPLLSSAALELKSSIANKQVVLLFAIQIFQQKES